MKNIFLITTIIINIKLNVYSQKITLIDSLYQTPIEYATIKYYNGDVFLNGNYSDSLGQFELINDLNFNKIKFSCIGYDDKYIFRKNLTKNKILLKPKIFALDEVFVLSTKKIKIGTYLLPKSKKTIDILEGYETSTLVIDTNYTNSKIHSISFFVKKIKNRVKFRINIYENSNKGLTPINNILKKNVIKELKPNDKGEVIVNLAEQNLIFPQNGVYISIEGLQDFEITKSFGKQKLFQIESVKSQKELYYSKERLSDVGWININKWIPLNYFETTGKKYDLDQLFVPKITLTLNQN